MTTEGRTVPVACSPGARAIAVRCEGRVNELARRISRQGFAHLPTYADLPDDLIDVEVAATVRYGLRLFLGAVRGKSSYGEEAYGLFRERAAQRATERLPLGLLLRTHLLAREALWQALREECRPGEEAALLELADFLFHAQVNLLGAVADTYLDEHSATTAARRARARALVLSLLDGAAPPVEQLRELGLTDGVLVLSLPLVVPGDAEAAVVVARRTEDALTLTLERLLAGPVVVVAEENGCLAFVAHPTGPLPADLARRVSVVLGTDALLGRSEAASPTELAEAAQTAREVRRLAGRLGRPAAVYGLQDVLLEYHLSRPGGSGTVLVGRLARVLADPELAETLRCYVDLQQDRRATATRLGVHPNTVGNRVRRAGELFGADLTTPRGYALALTALTAADLGSDF
ncbi:MULTISPECIES: CdaR family transcriptional regulator [Streptomyces]|uniref:PucR family transcriptional regulator n=1 Tax=Streptomyces TaxID=1883 RepID=UPI00278C2D68|nr:PucR family transcriptional regulator [Streptomyces hydrogenans]